MITPLAALDAAAQLKACYQRLKIQQPTMRARNAAEALGVSEGELLAARVGEGATCLIDDTQAILEKIRHLGEVMALTRNAHCVHERKGIYDNHEFFRHNDMAMGLFVNPDIDLRLFMNHWRYNFAVTEPTHGGIRKSLQFFDKEGHAIHKIYLTDNSHIAEYEKLVAIYRNCNQVPFIETESYESKVTNRPDDVINWAELRNAWEHLKDTHDFAPMLRKFKVGREQAFFRIGRDFAYVVDNSAARKVLQLVRDHACEIMVFVSNRGCIQIHTGTVTTLIESGPWYNVLDPLFNLHLREDQIARTWVTRKPTVDGIVTALEIFDKDSELIATFFGKRKPGISELVLWREIIAAVSAQKNGCVA